MVAPCLWLCSGAGSWGPARLGQHLPYKTTVSSKPHLLSASCLELTAVIDVCADQFPPSSLRSRLWNPPQVCVSSPTPRAPAEARGAATTAERLVLTPDEGCLHVTPRPGPCHPPVLPATPEAPHSIRISQVRLLKPRDDAAWPRATRPLRGTHHTSPLPCPPSCTDPNDTLYQPEAFCQHSSKGRKPFWALD